MLGLRRKQQTINRIRDNRLFFTYLSLSFLFKFSQIISDAQGANFNCQF